MEKQIRKIIYFVIFFFCSVLIIYFCLILRIPRKLVSFIVLGILFILSIVFFEEYEYEKNSIYLDKMSKRIKELSEIYSTEKMCVDCVSNSIYNSLYKDKTDNVSIITDFDEDYLLDFFDNLKRLSLDKKIEIDKLTLSQKSACLMDALLGQEAWVFKPVSKNFYELNCQAEFLNIELAIKVGFLLCGHTIEDSDVSVLATILSEAVKLNRTGDLLIINIIADILQNYSKNS